MMFNDKGGRGGLGKSDIRDEGEGGGSRIPQICMTSLKDSPSTVPGKWSMLNCK